MNRVRRLLIIFILLPLASHSGQPRCSFPQSPTEYVGFGFAMTGLWGFTKGLQQGLFELTSFCHGESAADRVVRVKQSIKQVGRLLVVSGSMAVTGFLLLDCSWNRCDRGNERRLGRW